MNDTDHARLARFLDGRLTPTERDAVLSHLASSEDARAILADAVTAMAEGDADRAGAESDRERVRFIRPRVAGRVALLAAAVIVVAVGVGTYRRVRNHSSSADVPASLALAIARSPAATLSIEDVWTATRGPEVNLSGTAKAVRIGALLVDIRLTLATGDSSRAHLAADLIRVLESYPTGAVAAASARHLLGGAGLSSDVVDSLFAATAEGALSEAAPAFVSAGAGVEAARLAASQHDARFLGRGAASRALTAAASEDTAFARAKANLAELEQRARGGIAIDWDSAAQRLTEVLRQLGD